MATDCKTFGTFITTPEGKIGTCTVCGIGEAYIFYSLVINHIEHNPAGHA